MSKSAGIIFVCLFFIVSLSQNALAEKRVALVIGNSAYKNISTLDNPANDAKLIANVLEGQGFEVILGLDLKYRAMKRVIRRYTAKLRSYGRDTIGFIFYAGHGLQVRGTNYLIPVAAEIESEGDVDIEAVSASSLLFGVRDARNRLNIIVLDACRNNPYRSLFRSTNRGLRQMNAPMGSLVAFSTSPGDVAADGSGKNSPFTAALAKSLQIPGLTIERIFKEARRKVYESTRNKQLPWINSSLLGEFYPAGHLKKPQPKPTLSLSIELAFWQSAKEQGTQRAYEAYIQKFPKGNFTPLALMMLDEYRRVQTTRVRQRAELKVVREKQAEAEAKKSKAETAKRRKELDDLRLKQKAEREKLAQERGDLGKHLKETEEAANRPGTEQSETDALAKDKSAKIIVANLPTEKPQKPAINNTDRNRKELARIAQLHLKRVGCYKNLVDGDWGAGSRRAMIYFNRYAKLKLSTDLPDNAAIGALKKIKRRICPNTKKVKSKQVKTKVNLVKKRKCPSNARIAARSLWFPGSLSTGRLVTGRHKCGRLIRCIGGNGRECKWL